MTEQRTTEWHEARRNLITGSMVGGILGLSPYMSRADAMRAMVRAREGAPREFEGNIATEWGTHNEMEARTIYELETGHSVEGAGFCIHPTEEWIGASPDGFVGDDGLVEIKCPFGLRNAEAPVPFKSIDDQPHYHAQIQVQLFVTGREWCDFFQWAANGTRLERVHLDHDWLSENLPRLSQFYSEFLEEDAAAHLAPKRVEIDTPDAHSAMDEWDDLCEQEQRVKERKADLLAKLVEMADGKDALIAGRKLTKVQREGSVSYAKLVKDLLPDAPVDLYRGKASEFWKVT